MTIANLRTVLLLEDESIIALDMKDMLRQEGASDVVWFDNSAEALEWLGANAPDLAVIDPRLKDGPCTDVAKLIAERGIPFVVYSGDVGAALEADPAFAKGARLSKPSVPEQVAEAMRTALLG